MEKEGFGLDFQSNFLFPTNTAHFRLQQRGREAARFFSTLTFLTFVESKHGYQEWSRGPLTGACECSLSRC